VRRRLFTLASLLSLLLFVATVVVWVRSYLQFTSVSRYTSGLAVYLTVSNGKCFVSRDTGTGAWNYLKAAEWNFENAPLNGETVDTGPSFFGFEWRHTESNGSGWQNTSIEVATPLWAITVLASLLPSYWVIARVLRHRVGRCIACGYSLTGNTSGTCPECGTPIPQVSRPA
jgi:hypothetical protein